jgi:hypothetical protein
MSHPAPTSCIHVPMFDTMVASHRLRKSVLPSGAQGPTAGPGAGFAATLEGSDVMARARSVPWYARQRARGFAGAARLEQEPDAPLGFVDPHFQQARRRDVAVLVADAVRFAHAVRQARVVLAQLGEHVERRHVLGVVVEHALQRAMWPIERRSCRRACGRARRWVGRRVELVGLRRPAGGGSRGVGARDVPVEVSWS